EDVRDIACTGTTDVQGVRCRAAFVLLTSGPDKDTVVTLETSVGPGAPELSEGDRIVVGFTPDLPEGAQYYFSDFQRGPPLVWLALLFAGAVVLLGRMRGVRALAGLAISLLVLLVFVLPSILEGSSPIAVAVVGSSVILLANLYLAHGFNLRTTTAVVGTLVSLALIGLLAVIFVAAAHFTGLGTEEATFLQAASSRINLKGLLLGGIIIGSLGVLDDVTVTQSSAVWELHQANPGLGPRRLYHSALRIGRDHIASTVNTLVLAYAGASLPLLILLVEANQDVANVLTGELVAVEIVRTLVGSIGLVASVPITTALAALVVSREEHAPAGVATEVP
ncbi:MAG TPA: YibE/F family protein, partial [Acidimicrobiales bacterium]|nr:YibE/F family protein [Acidimicrobiales bacterium]